MQIAPTASIEIRHALAAVLSLQEYDARAWQWVDVSRLLQEASWQSTPEEDRVLAQVIQSIQAEPFLSDPEDLVYVFGLVHGYVLSLPGDTTETHQLRVESYMKPVADKAWGILSTQILEDLGEAAKDMEEHR